MAKTRVLEGRVGDIGSSISLVSRLLGAMLDTMRQVESHLVTRHYDGFLRKATSAPAADSPLPAFAKPDGPRRPAFLSEHGCPVRDSQTKSSE